MAYDFIEFIVPKKEFVPSITKSFKYVFEMAIPTYIKYTYPLFTQFMVYYGEFLDENFEGVSYNLLDVYNSDTANLLLLEYMFNQYFKDVINDDKIKLTSSNKRLFVSLSKNILNMKLNPNIINVFFNNLRDYEYIDDNGDVVSVESLNAIYEENEDWWIPGAQWFIDHPTSETYETYPQDIPNEINPFTYKFSLDNTVDVIRNIFENIHPLGYYRLFFRRFSTEEEVGIDEVVTMTATYSSGYSGRYNHDGVIKYDGSSVAIPIT